MGRARDIDRVSSRLADARLCGLTGPLGVGKSHLAQQVAWSLGARFAAGVFWCDATSASSEDDLESLIEAVHTPLGAVLLVVDGADACAEAARAVVPRWLGQHPMRKALVTSRERAGIRGEVVVPLDPLSPADAVTLFIDRARAADDRFVPTELERRAIDQIVRWVDALPLAVCLCAAQTLVLRPPALLEHLQSADARLDTRAGGDSLRQTVRSAFALLPEDARPVLVACSTFVGAFTFDAAAAVAGASLASLMALCQRSFLRVSDEGGTRRFRLYRPIQDFAAGLGVDDTLRDRHRAWYRARLERGEDVDETRQNLLASAAHDVEMEHTARALDTLIAVTPLVLLQGPTVHTLALLERAWPSAPTPEALHAAGRLRLLDGQFAAAAALFDTALTALPETSPLAAAVLSERATAARLMGHVREATELYGQALAHPAGDPHVGARTLERLAGHLFEQGQRAIARTRLDEAHDAYAAIADHHGVARVQHALGLLEQEEGNRAAAATLFRDAQTRHSALGDQRFAAIARFDEGALLLEDDAPGAARPVLADAVDRLETLGDRRQVALGRALLGVCAARLDDPHTARPLLEQALAEAEAIADVAMRAAIRVHAGHLDTSPAQALARIPAATFSDEERYAVRLLEWAVRQAGETLSIAVDGTFIQRADGPRTELKSLAARRILTALLEARSNAAAELTSNVLFRRGWPGERVLDDAARNRLQVALSMLRKAGLGEHLVRTGEGYRLEGNVRVKARRDGTR